jgi:hypothetical protein
MVARMVLAGMLCASMLGCVRARIAGSLLLLPALVACGEGRLAPTTETVSSDDARESVLENDDVVHGSGHPAPRSPVSLASILAVFPERALPYHLDDETSPGPSTLREIPGELVDRHLWPPSDFASAERPSRYYAVARFPSATGFTGFTALLYLEHLHETDTEGGHLYHLATVSNDTGRIVSRLFFYGFGAVQEGRARTEHHAVFGVVEPDHTVTSVRQTWVIDGISPETRLEASGSRVYETGPSGRIRTVRVRAFRPLGEMPGQNPNMAQVDVFERLGEVEWEYREIASLLVEDVRGSMESVRAQLVDLAREIGGDAVVIHQVHETPAGAYRGEAVALVYLDERHRWYWRYR